MTKGNPGESPADRTPSRASAPSGLDRVRAAARRDPSDGPWSRTTVGTPQGAVISPLLANLYLHHVLDLWVQAWRKREARGEVILARFGLDLHQDKTRLFEFGRYATANRARRGQGKPETLDFLGFTHMCGKRRSDGRYTVVRQTMAKRLRAKAKAVKEWLMAHRHGPVPKVGRWLRAVVQGYLNYHAVPGNWRALAAFRRRVSRAWLHALRRRSQKGRRLSWARMARLIHTWLPLPRILHPYPPVRFYVRHPRQEPYEVILRVRNCAGGARQRASLPRSILLLPGLRWELMVA